MTRFINSGIVKSSYIRQTSVTMKKQYKHQYRLSEKQNETKTHFFESFRYYKGRRFTNSEFSQMFWDELAHNANLRKMITKMIRARQEKYVAK